MSKAKRWATENKAREEKRIVSWISNKHTAKQAAVVYSHKSSEKHPLYFPKMGNSNCQIIGHFNNNQYIRKRWAKGLTAK